MQSSVSAIPQNLIVDQIAAGSRLQPWNFAVFKHTS